MGKRLLIVDDEDLLRENLVRFFNRKGFEVYQAASGNQALALLYDQQIELIISDMRMADGDGLYLYHQSRNLNLPPDFIFLTGFSETSEEELLKLPGVKFVATKPIEKKVLLEKISLLISK